MNREKLSGRLLWASAAAVLGLCALVAGSLKEPIVSTGDKAPNFKVTTDRGKTLSRSEFGGKVLVLNFWATWCPPCIDEIPSLNVMAQQLAPKGVVVLGVSVDKNQEIYRRFLAGVRPSFETAHDPAADISASYGTFKYPETYIIDREGRVRQKHIGGRNWTDPEIVQSIEALL
jgi:peroxiredoxin